MPPPDGRFEMAGRLVHVFASAPIRHVQVTGLALTESHPEPVVLDNERPALAALLGKRDPDFGRLSVPGVGHELRDGSDGALVHLDAQVVDDPTVIPQDKVLLGRGHATHSRLGGKEFAYAVSMTAHECGR